jgi:nitrogen fixation protein NifU and related proteins
MDVTDLYEQIIIDHSKHPKGEGLREPYDAEAHHVNPTCGDEVTVRVALDGGAIRDLSYHGEGCSISRASASVMHELVQGAPLEHTLAVQEAFHALVTGRGQVEPDEELLEDAVAFAGVARYPMRVKCALLPWMAFKDAAARAVSGGKA